MTSVGQLASLDFTRENLVAGDHGSAPIPAKALATGSRVEAQGAVVTLDEWGQKLHFLTRRNHREDQCHLVMSATGLS